MLRSAQVGGPPVGVLGGKATHPATTSDQDPNVENPSSEKGKSTNQQPGKKDKHSDSDSDTSNIGDSQEQDQSSESDGESGGGEGNRSGHVDPADGPSKTKSCSTKCQAKATRAPKA